MLIDTLLNFDLSTFLQLGGQDCPPQEVQT